MTSMGNFIKPLLLKMANTWKKANIVSIPKSPKVLMIPVSYYSIILHYQDAKIFALLVANRLKLIILT